MGTCTLRWHCVFYDVMMVVLHGIVFPEGMMGSGIDRRFFTQQDTDANGFSFLPLLGPSVRNLLT